MDGKGREGVIWFELAGDESIDPTLKDESEGQGIDDNRAVFQGCWRACGFSSVWARNVGASCTSCTAVHRTGEDSTGSSTFSCNYGVERLSVAIAHAEVSDR